MISPWGFNVSRGRVVEGGVKEVEGLEGRVGREVRVN